MVEDLIGRLRARGLLNDERYAGHFVQYHARAARARYGSAAILKRWASIRR